MCLKEKGWVEKSLWEPHHTLVGEKMLEAPSPFMPRWSRVGTGGAGVGRGFQAAALFCLIVGSMNSEVEITTGWTSFRARVAGPGTHLSLCTWPMEPLSPGRPHRGFQGVRQRILGGGLTLKPSSLTPIGGCLHFILS